MFSIDSTLNKPSLCIDHQPVSPILYSLSDFPAAASFTHQAQRNILNFKEAGIDLVGLDVKLHTGWHRVTPFDPSSVLAEIANALEANPEASFLVRLHVNPPYWWMRDHPDECVIYRMQDGDYAGMDDGEYERLIYHDGDRHLRVSLASEKWLHDAGEKLSLLCDALAVAPEGQSVMGIQPACGIYGEWHQWGTDVSAPMQARFRRFLREKYGDDARLQAAWGDASVTIDSAPFHPETFRPGDDGMFRDPARSRFVMDAQECVQSVSPDAILHFARILKEKLPGVLVGAFYGYYLGTGGNNNMTIGGHLQVERMFRARGLIDFMCGPFCYMENRRTDGVPMQRALLESGRLRGMLWLTEMDQHPEGQEEAGVADPMQYPATIATLRRNVLQPLLAGHGMWFYDHRIVPLVSKNGLGGSIYRKRGWWDVPELMEEIARLQKLAHEVAARPYQPAADVLLVYDKASYYCRARAEDCAYRIHEAIVRCGVAFDCIYTDELEVAELSRYRFVLMVNAYQVTPEQRERYRSLLRGIPTMWLYASGFCDGDTLGVAHMSATVGMEIRRTEGVKTMSSGTESIEVPETFSPLFAVVEEEDVTALMRYDNGEIAAARRGNDLWAALPLLTRRFMEPILRECGAHIYCEDGDPILAGAGLVAINCPAGGTRRIRLSNGRMVQMELPPFTTAVLDGESGERLM